MITQTNEFEIKNVKEFESEELFGATITRLLSREKLPTVGFDHVKLNKGSILKPHTHSSSESFIYILEGTPVVTLNGQNFRVKAGDTIHIPASTSHGFSAPDNAVAWLSVQSPPIYPEQSAPDIQFNN